MHGAADDIPEITMSQILKTLYDSSMKILLKQIRIRKGLSLRQVEYMTGISHSALSRIENEEVDVGMTVLEEIAKGLHIRISDLYDSQYK